MSTKQTPKSVDPTTSNDPTGSAELSDAELDGVAGGAAGALRIGRPSDLISDVDPLDPDAAGPEEDDILTSPDPDA